MHIISNCRRNLTTFGFNYNNTTTENNVVLVNAAHPAVMTFNRGWFINAGGRSTSVTVNIDLGRRSNRRYGGVASGAMTHCQILGIVYENRGRVTRLSLSHLYGGVRGHPDDTTLPNHANALINGMTTLGNRYGVIFINNQDDQFGKDVAQKQGGTTPAQLTNYLFRFVPLAGSNLKAAIKWMTRASNKNGNRVLVERGKLAVFVLDRNTRQSIDAASAAIAKDGAYGPTPQTNPGYRPSLKHKIRNRARGQAAADRVLRYPDDWDAITGVTGCRG